MTRFTYKEIKDSFHSEEPWINIFVFSHITIPLVYFMVNFTRITPNIISILSLILGIASAVLYFYGFVISAAVMYLLSYILDATDGKVARLTNTGKNYGAWFDIFVDRMNLTLISTAISYHYYAEHTSIDLLLYNSIFLGLAFIGSESRYNITLFQTKNNIIDNTVKISMSRYDQWRKKHRLIKEPISLPEIFIFYLVIAPVFGLEIFAVVINIVFLIIRLLKQQKFWIDANK